MSVRNAIRNPRTYLGGVVNTYRSLLFDPEGFYDELNSAGLRDEALLALVVGFLGLIGPYLAVQTLLTPFGVGVTLPDEVPLNSEVALRLRSFAVTPFLMTIGLWLLVAITTYLGSYLYSERGSLRHLLKNTAWGLVPVAFTNAIFSVANYVVVQGVDVSSNNPSIWFRQVPTGTATIRAEYIWERIAEDPLVTGAALVGLVFLAWSWYIWAYALEDVRRIELRRAFIIAAIPTAAFLVYRLYDIATLMELL